MTVAFPLQWPTGWPRSKSQDSSSRFTQEKYVSSTVPGGSSYKTRTQISFAKARDKLYAELDRLGASSVVISSNHKPDVRGIPIESKRSVGDEGVAIYFKYTGKAMTMACDRYDTAAGNMRSLGLAIEGMRQLERHGGGTMMERAFAGFVAIPSQSNWSKILEFMDEEVSIGLTVVDIEAAYKRLAKQRHPDAPGGSTEKMTELNVARDQALRELQR